MSYISKKTGERKLSPADYRKQESRRNYQLSNERWFASAQRYRNVSEQMITREIEHILRTSQPRQYLAQILDQSERDMRRSYVRLYATMRMLYKHQYSKEASATGDVNFCRACLADHTARLHFWTLVNDTLYGDHS